MDIYSVVGERKMLDHLQLRCTRPPENVDALASRLISEFGSRFLSWRTSIALEFSDYEQVRFWSFQLYVQFPIFKPTSSVPVLAVYEFSSWSINLQMHSIPGLSTQKQLFETNNMKDDHILHICLMAQSWKTNQVLNASLIQMDVCNLCLYMGARLFSRLGHENNEESKYQRISEMGSILPLTALCSISTNTALSSLNMEN